MDPQSSLVPENVGSQNILDGHDIIVVGASAGGVEALTEMAAALPADLPAAVFVVLHIPPYGSSVLPRILGRRSRLPARHPQDGEKVQPGHIYVAPPDHHLVLRDHRIHLTRGPTENGHRPAVDTLFRSAARIGGPRVIGVVLTGTLDDGTAGLQTIKQRGGTAIVQDPAEALFASMPRSAIENVAVDYILPLAGIAGKLTQLAQKPISSAKSTFMLPSTNRKEKISETEVAISEMNQSALETPRAGKPSGYSCPDCQGVLWELEDGGLMRFRCRVGHAFSPESLIAAQSESMEEALWAALRALEESAALAERLHDRAQERGHDLAARRFESQARDTHQRATLIRTVLLGGQVIAESGPPRPEARESSKLPS